MNIQTHDVDAALTSVGRRFPSATTIELDYHAAKRLDACLVALPDNSWPAVEVISVVMQYKGDPCCYLSASTATQVVRLCPRLREVSCEASGAAGLAAALEGLAPVAGPLEAASLKITGEVEPSAMPRAVEALRRLDGLRQLKVDWDREPGAAALLGPALQELTSLSSLEVAGGAWWEAAQPPQPLDLQPGPLRELGLDCRGHLNALRAFPCLGGVTELKLVG